MKRKLSFRHFIQIKVVASSWPLNYATDKANLIRDGSRLWREHRMLSDILTEELT